MPLLDEWSHVYTFIQKQHENLNSGQKIYQRLFDPLCIICQICVCFCESLGIFVWLNMQASKGQTLWAREGEICRKYMFTRDIKGKQYTFLPSNSYSNKAYLKVHVGKLVKIIAAHFSLKNPWLWTRFVIGIWILVKDRSKCKIWLCD